MLRSALPSYVPSNPSRGDLTSASQCYATALAYTSTSSLPYAQTASLHLTGVLLATFVVYAARDLAPLARYGGHPSDGNGPLLWITISLLFATGILLPLVTPGKHVPVNKEVRKARFVGV